MTPRPFTPLRFALPALLILLAGCGGNTPPRTASPECLGQIRLTVTNDWNQPIEVHRAGTPTAGPTLIGYLAAGGRQEFLLPPNVRSVYTLWLDGNVTKAIPRQYRRLIRFRYECEPPRGS